MLFHLFFRADVYAVYLSVVLSFRLSCILSVPQLSFHILKPYITRIKPTVSASDRLIYWWVSSVSVSFMIEVMGQGHTDTFLTSSLFGYCSFCHFLCLFTQLDRCELQGHMLKQLLTLTAEFQEMSQAILTSCCNASVEG